MLALACFAALVGGCKDTPNPPKKVSKQAAPATPEVDPPLIVAPGVRVELGKVGRSCRRTLCIAGPGELGGVGNLDLAELCRRSPGVVKRCDSEGCATLWASDNWQQGLDALLLTLDRDKDGKVDAGDRACPINLAGWSTGAVIVADALPKALAERAQGSHTQVENLLAITPYQRELAQLEVAANVTRAFVYRNTATPKEDCSLAFEGGPWRSPPLVCSEGTRCYDYDYSQKPTELAYRTRRGARAGSEIGHCNMPSAVAEIGLDNISRGREALAEFVPPYIDGSQGGRERPRGPAVPDPIVLLPNEPAK